MYTITSKIIPPNYLELHRRAVVATSEHCQVISIFLIKFYNLSSFCHHKFHFQSIHKLFAAVSRSREAKKQKNNAGSLSRNDKRGPTQDFNFYAAFLQFYATLWSKVSSACGMRIRGFNLANFRQVSNPCLLKHQMK